MWNPFKKQNWTVVAASEIHAGDIVSLGAITGEVDYVGHISIADHPYVDILVRMPKPIFGSRFGKAKLPPESPVNVVKK